MKKQFIQEIGIHAIISQFNVLGMTPTLYKAFKSKRTPANANNS